MTFKIFRRGSARCFGLLAAFITILLCLYYISLGQSSGKDFRKRYIESHHPRKFSNQSQRPKDNSINLSLHAAESLPLSWEKCNGLSERSTQITTMDEYSKFDFQPEWMKTKEYWDKSFETRYEKIKKDDDKPLLKIYFSAISVTNALGLKELEQIYYFEYSVWKNIYEIPFEHFNIRQNYSKE